MIRRSTWILLILFVVSLSGTILWQRYRAKQEAETTPTPEASLFFDISSADVVQLEIIQPTGKAVVLRSDAPGVWVLEGFTAEQTDAGRVESILQQLSSLRVLSPLEQAPAAEIVGLSQPSYIIRVKLSNGGQKTAYIGDVTPTGSGYYARLEGGNVVIINKYSIDSVVELLANKPLLPTATPTEAMTPTVEQGTEPEQTPVP